VYVNGKACVVPIWTDKEKVSCTLPPGAGYDQLVMLSSLNRLAVPVPLLSYGLPVIHAIGFWDPRQNMCKLSSFALLDCPRVVDALMITLTGENFGPGSATLFGNYLTYLFSSCIYVILYSNK
jgi:hypothetical protein